jgi:DNA-binding response OmpR family regulator
VEIPTEPDPEMSNVVIIEDDALMRGLLAEWLTAAGYRVHEVRRVDGATLPPADVVIVDLYMPRQLGVERLRSTRRSFPGVPIIAISGQFRAGVDCSGPAARTLGADRVIPKPCGREALLDTVRSVIGPSALAPA